MKAESSSSTGAQSSTGSASSPSSSGTSGDGPSKTGGAPRATARPTAGGERQQWRQAEGGKTEGSKSKSDCFKSRPSPPRSRPTNPASPAPASPARLPAGRARRRPARRSRAAPAIPGSGPLDPARPPGRLSRGAPSDRPATSTATPGAPASCATVIEVIRLPKRSTASTSPSRLAPSRRATGSGWRTRSRAGGPSSARRHPARQVRGRRREDVAPVKSPGDLGQPVAGRLQRHRRPAGIGEGEGEETVVGADESLPARLQRQRPPRAPHPGVDHGEVNGARREEAHRALEGELGAPHVLAVRSRG